MRAIPCQPDFSKKQALLQELKVNTSFLKNDMLYGSYSSVALSLCRVHETISRIFKEYNLSEFPIQNIYSSGKFSGDQLQIEIAKYIKESAES